MSRLYCLLLLLLLPCCAMAQDGIHRCLGADGHPVFTDQPCAALQATPVNAPPPAATPATAGTTAATPAPISCATTVADLRQGLADAFAARDPNRLAGMMIWNGYGRDAVVASIRSLGALMQHPLLDIGVAGEDDTAPPADGSGGTGGPGPLLVHTASADGSGMPHETRFEVVRRSGCLWLRGGD